MRFVVHESHGWYRIVPNAGRGGITCTVLDTVYNHRVVGLFRSEDHTGIHTEKAYARVREAADRLAALLNSEDS